MWRIAGSKFSWARSQDGRTNILLYPAWHALTPNLNKQHPDFEYDEVIQLNRMEVLVSIEAGTSDHLVTSVKDQHRYVGYFPEPGEHSKEFAAMVSLIENRIHIEVRLAASFLELTLSDLMFATSQSSGYYMINLASRFVDLTRSLGVKPDAKARFLQSELPVLIPDKVRMHYAVGEEVPSTPSERDISSALARIASE